MPLRPDTAGSLLIVCQTPPAGRRLPVATPSLTQPPLSPPAATSSLPTDTPPHSTPSPVCTHLELQLTHPVASPSLAAILYSQTNYPLNHPLLPHPAASPSPVSSLSLG